MELIEDLDKAAHVCALELMGQIDIHVDAGHGRLCAVGLIQDHDGVGQGFHPDLTDVNTTKISGTLDIFHTKDRCSGSGERAGTIAEIRRGGNGWWP